MASFNCPSGGVTTFASLDLTERSKSASAPFVQPVALQSPEPSLFVIAGDGDLSAPTYSVALSKTDWSKSNERRFDDLAEKKALGEATESELEELNGLRLARRKHKNPMSAEEVMFHYQRRKMESKLLNDLKEYVHFLEAPRRS